MVSAERLANWEKLLRPIATKLPPPTVVSKYSAGRLDFLAKLKEEQLAKSYTPQADLSRTLWGIRFGSPIMNAAGMFKNAECYAMVAAQGAGGYIGGTTTHHEREGNKKEDVYLPFTPYPRSHAASNWLGLPNYGDAAVAEILESLRFQEGCPVGMSVMGSPNFKPEQANEKLDALVQGLFGYAKKGVDFLEMNESCPNTEHGRPQDSDLAGRLKYVKDNFLDHRSRYVPVVVKFSNDTQIEQVPELVTMLIELGFDGVNFGNTSIDYKKRREQIAPSERKLFDYFTSTFTGGISGRPLKEDSLRLASAAVQVAKEKAGHEFHVIRTGGIESAADIKASNDAGISLNQWYTGYFENFSKHGHRVYEKLYSELKK